MEQGWDPQVKSFFRKILNSFMYGLLWLMTGITAGIYFDLGSTSGKSLAYPLVFYFIMAVTLFLLIRYLYRTWK